MEFLGIKSMGTLKKYNIISIMCLFIGIMEGGMLRNTNHKIFIHLWDRFIQC